MDRGGQFQPLNPRLPPAEPNAFRPPRRITLFLRRASARLSRPPLRHLGLALFVMLFAATGSYGAVQGGHAEALFAALREAGDAIARGAGFGIAHAEVRGVRTLQPDALLRQAGVSETSSLLLLDAGEVRARLKRNPWIAKATVRKFYPDRLEIAIEERAAFARWQRAGRLHLIARDGTVLESDIAARYADLPLVVGVGADKQVAALLDLVERFPAIRAELRAGVLVAERRWNLRLKNGIDVRLPEEDPALALERLVALDQSRRLLSRDLVVIDLRVPDRVAVKLSEEAAAGLKPKTPKRQGADS